MIVSILNARATSLSFSLIIYLNNLNCSFPLPLVNNNRGRSRSRSPLSSHGNISAENDNRPLQDPTKEIYKVSLPSTFTSLHTSSVGLPQISFSFPVKTSALGNASNIISQPSNAATNFAALITVTQHCHCRVSSLGCKKWWVVLSDN